MTQRDSHYQSSPSKAPTNTFEDGSRSRLTGRHIQNRKCTTTARLLAKRPTTYQVRNYDPTVFRNNIIAHASTAKTLDLSIVPTTSAETGPNDILPKKITALYPNAPPIKCKGEVDESDNPDFRTAVAAQNKSHTTPLTSPPMSVRNPSTAPPTSLRATDAPHQAPNTSPYPPAPQATPSSLTPKPAAQSYQR